MTRRRLPREKHHAKVVPAHGGRFTGLVPRPIETFPNIPSRRRCLSPAPQEKTPPVRAAVGRSTARGPRNARNEIVLNDHCGCARRVGSGKHKCGEAQKILRLRSASLRRYSGRSSFGRMRTGTARRPRVSGPVCGGWGDLGRDAPAKKTGTPGRCTGSGRRRARVRPLCRPTLPARSPCPVGRGPPRPRKFAKSCRGALQYSLAAAERGARGEVSALWQVDGWVTEGPGSLARGVVGMGCMMGWRTMGCTERGRDWPMVGDGPSCGRSGGD
jgi:hypothetical protein